MAFLFPRTREVLAIHARLIETSGGAHGLRDAGALESALAAAPNRHHYEQADLATCAATYAYHLSQAHAFADGNKRVAAAVSEIFVELNGGRLATADEQIVKLFLGIAAGEVSREAVEEFFRRWTTFSV